MPKFICIRDVVAAGGHQEFAVKAGNEKEARELFAEGKGELVFSEVEVTALSEYDLDSIWEDQ